jgi:signal transduction histidine kinase/ActR/RegA family two-component response regulator
LIICGENCAILQQDNISKLTYKVITSNYCFNHLVNEKLIEFIFEKGGYILTVGWLKNWRNRLVDEGFDRVTAQLFYSEFCKELVLLETGIDLENKIRIEELSDYLGIPYKILNIGLDNLKIFLRSVVFEWRLNRKNKELDTYLQDTRKQASEYSAVLHIIEQIAGYSKKSEIVDKLKEIFQTLFGANITNFIEKSADTEDIEFVRNYCNEFISNPSTEYLISKERNEISIKIQHNGELFGIFKAGDFLFPQFLTRYINFALGIARVSALALSNSNQYELLKKSNSKLEQTNVKLENANGAKRQFLANMSHEIRTPMNAVMGFLELLSTSNLNSEQKMFISEAKSASDILLYLINDILDFSKIEAGKLNIEKIAFSLRPTIKDAVSLLVPKASEKNINLYYAIKSSVPEEVIGDPSRLKQILVNLVSNAVKFTAKGEVSITVGCIEEENEVALLQFEVKDSGIGICKEDIPNLFKSFNQADTSTTRKYGGTGLGLAISKKLVEMMDGDIDVQSKLGEGSTFKFDVRLKICRITPKESSVLERLDDAYIPVSNSNKKKPKILLAEDNEINRIIIIKFLDLHNMNCDVALNGKEAYESVLNTNYDIILMDCQMPVMDGYESTAKIRDFEGEKTHTFIIAMTANAMDGDKKKCIESGMDDYISKPINFDNMFKIIEERMNYKEQNSKSIAK